MSIGIARGTTDEVLEQIIEVLRAYEADHPHAEIDLYRRDPFSIRVRIVDPDFSGKEELDRDKIVWRYFDELPEEVEVVITMLVLLTPDETSTSGSNMVFDDPVPSD